MPPTVRPGTKQTAQKPKPRSQPTHARPAKAISGRSPRGARPAARAPASRSRQAARQSGSDLMPAVRFRRPKAVSVAEVPAPRIEESRDVVLDVTSTAICGSDLHIYNGLLPQLRPMTLGHEFMGTVREVGPKVRGLRVGDRVAVPFVVADGSCWFCQKDLQPHCEHSNENYGPGGHLMSEKGAGLFGYTDLYGGYDGGQAAQVRVPFADHGAVPIPDDLTDEQALFLTDIFPTGWSAIDWAQVQEGESVAVFGCGPVGIMAQKAARLHGAGEVIGIDPLEYRRRIASKAGEATTLDPGKDDVVERIRELTGGRGADVVVDAVGMEPDRNVLEKANAIVHGQRGSMKVLRDCFDAVRRGGRVSIVGVYGTTYDNYPLHQQFDKGLQVFAGQALVHRHIDHLLGLVTRGEVQLDDIITHRMPLADAAQAYKLFNQKEDDCLKVVLKP